MSRNFPLFFTQKIKSDQFRGFWEQLRITRHNFSIFFLKIVLNFSSSIPKLVNFPNFFRNPGIKKNNVNTKTSQFSQFFLDSRNLRKNVSIPKLINFFMFWSPRKNNVNTKTSQFSHFFLNSRNLKKKICQHQN